jgi:hypothetical protein
MRAHLTAEQRGLPSDPWSLALSAAGRGSIPAREEGRPAAGHRHLEVENPPGLGLGPCPCPRVFFSTVGLAVLGAALRFCLSVRHGVGSRRALSARADVVLVVPVVLVPKLACLL